MARGLLLIDIQADYFPGGRMELQGADAAGLRARVVLDRFRSAGLPVFHVQHLAIQPGATFLLPETPGARIHPNVEPAAGETVIRKHYPNAFRDTALAAELEQRSVRELVIAGMMTHMCVDATVRAAFDLGHACTVVHDACATRALAFNGQTIPAAEVHGAFLSALGSVYATVVSAEQAAVATDARARR